MLHFPQTELSPLWISLKTAGTATLMTFFLGLALAWMISRKPFPGRELIDGLLLLPMVLPPTVVGFILLLIFGKNGPIGQLLFKFGAAIVFSWPATVIAAATVALPLMYKTARASFEQVDSHIVDAARTLGAGEWRIFRKIIVPLSWPGIVAGISLSFARALGEFGATLMLAGSIPGKTQTLPVAIYFAAESGEMGKALVLVLIIAVISLATLSVLSFWSKSQQRSLSIWWR